MRLRYLVARTGVGAFLFTMLVGGRATAQETQLWEQVVRKYATPAGFDYAGLRSDTTLRRAHQRFVQQLERMPEEAPLSMWLNAYNALVVHAIVERPTIGSVKDVPGFFTSVTYTVAGKASTLDDIENKVIRPRFKDARVHVALNCGAKSCPPLHARAFRQSTLNATLAQLARAVVRSPQFVEVKDGQVAVSQIFHWFTGDFVRDAGSVADWLKRYDKESRLAGVASDTELGTLPYDWGLNTLALPDKEGT